MAGRGTAGAWVLVLSLWGEPLPPPPPAAMEGTAPTPELSWNLGTALPAPLPTLC